MPFVTQSPHTLDFGEQLAWVFGDALFAFAVKCAQAENDILVLAQRRLPLWQ